MFSYINSPFQERLLDPARSPEISQPKHFSNLAKRRWCFVVSFPPGFPGATDPNSVPPLWWIGLICRFRRGRLWSFWPLPLWHLSYAPPFSFRVGFVGNISRY